MRGDREPTRLAAMEDLAIAPNRATSISQMSSVMMMLPGLIGQGVMSLSKHFKCGIIFATVIHIIVVLLVYYSTWMLAHLMKLHRKGTYEQLWVTSKFKFSIIVSLSIFLPCIGFLSIYFNLIKDLWSSFLVSVMDSPPSLIIDPYMIYTVLIALVFSPLVMRQDKWLICVCGWVKCALTLVFTGLCIYWCVAAQSNPLNSGKKVVLFNMEEDWLAAAGEFLGTYLDYFFLFNSLNHMVDMTYKRCWKVVNWSFGIFFVWCEVLCIFQYFIFYDRRSHKNMFEDMDPTWATVKIGKLLFMLITILSFPVYFDSLRISALYIIEVMESYPKFVWSAIGFLWLLVTATCATIAGAYMDLFVVIGNILAMIMQFMGPALMFIRVIDTVSKVHWIGIIFFIVLGAGMGIYLLISIKDLF